MRLAWARLTHPRPVLVTVSSTSLVFCWRSGRTWMFRAAAVSGEACCDGFPQQREGIAELIADLVFDLELPGAELVLCLPPSAAHWCVIDGMKEVHWDNNGLCRDSLVSIDLPFNLENSYLLSTAVQSSIVIAGVSRALLQAWSDVVERADLPLRRVSWSLLDAHRALIQITQDWSGDLAWLLVHEGKARLVLMRDRTPELDVVLSSNQAEIACSEIRASIHAWHQSQGAIRPLGWWFTMEVEDHAGWHQIVDVEAGEQVLNTELRWFPEPWGDVEEGIALPPLAHLALMALREEESW